MSVRGLWLPVTFRLARATDRETYDWRPVGVSQARPLVVTVDGKLAVVETRPGEIAYQDDWGGLAQLLRARRHVLEAVQERYSHRAEREEADSIERLRQSTEWMRGG